MLGESGIVSEDSSRGWQVARAGVLYMWKFSNTDVHRPCNNMVTILGMPKYYRPESGPAGIARLYVNNIVKVTEDFISYDLLR